MDIFEIMDCVDCPSYDHHAECLTADPYGSEPEESVCSDGDFGRRHACGRMLGAINDLISDGELETGSGCFVSREWAEKERQGGHDSGAESWFTGFDFSSAPFWWIPDDYALGEVNGEPMPYRSEQEIYDDWFS
jgi:hypothetical protein